MKKVLISMALLFLSFEGYAAECRVNGGRWFNLHTTGATDVSVTMTPSYPQNRLELSGYSLDCAFSVDDQAPGREDYYHTTYPGVTFLGKLAGQTGGLVINGTTYSAPIAGNNFVATVPSYVFSVPINLYPYINLSANPEDPINIVPGDRIADVSLLQSNNFNGFTNNITLRLIASNSFTLDPSNCKINAGQLLDVNFGTVAGREVDESIPGQKNRVTKRLSYSCPAPGLTLPITVTLRGTGAGFNSQVLKMSNADLGVVMERGGQVVPLGSSFTTNLTNSTGGDDVTFSLVRRPGSAPATGVSSGSGVLVIGVP
ncbi:MAG: fimbrial protein [Serratia sp. (in: enterobacteria)]|uniref:fimbrial protein n=1 Tax=Serratia sp. (in: enterobacteria) TaxID=616 RepID=UPI003F3229AA